MAIKVLIVDDSKLARMAAAKALNTLRPGWIRIEATNADEALALAKQSAVAIALLDYNMPGRDGLSLAADLKALDPAIVIALISANVQQEIVQQATRVGAVFLAKPLTPPALEEFLSHVEAGLKASDP